MNSLKNRGMTKLINNNLSRVLAGAFIGLGLASATISTGCNTVKGAGEDLERGGEKLQNSADRHGAR